MARRHEFTEDLYRVLGVARDADLAEIRRVGRQRQRAAHPDLGGSADEFVRVRIAVEVLTDEGMRAEHDAWLAAREGNQRRGPRIRRQPVPRTTPAMREREATPAPAPAPTESKPPERIPTPDTDVRKMAWFRTAWPATPTLWPARTAKLPELRPGELAAVIAHVVVLLGATLALALPMSPARLTAPDLINKQPGSLVWPVPVAYCLLGVTWLTLRLRVRRPGLAWTLLLTLMPLAIVSALVVCAIGLVSLIATLGHTDSVTLFLQSLCYAATAVTMFIASVKLKHRAKLAERERLLVKLAEEALPGESSLTRVWGQPGQTVLGGVGLYPGVNPMRAILAQREVGRALEQLARMPGVRIVHGLDAPGRASGSVPHAVIAGRRIALIDAQLVAPGRYAIDRKGRMTRDGVVFPTTATEFPHAVERYHELFGEGVQLRGWITVLAEREGEITVDNALTWERVRLATCQSMLREVGDWLAAEGEQVDRLLVRDLLRHRL